jgi:hypothetical protein
MNCLLLAEVPPDLLERSDWPCTTVAAMRRVCWDWPGLATISLDRVDAEGTSATVVRTMPRGTDR